MVSLVCKTKGDVNMKLCIVKPDGVVAEILLRDRQPSFEACNNEQLFFENYKYKFILRGIEEYENVEIFVGDYSVPIHYKASMDWYETDQDLVFNGCFDLAYISVWVSEKEGKEECFYTDFLRIATTKQTTTQVEQMLGEIEKNIPNFLEICFSRNQKKSGLKNDSTKSIWNTLKLVDEIIKTYEENYDSFFNHKKSFVEPVASVEDVRSMRVVNQESLRWIACNPDNLVKTDKKMGISFNGQNYMPSKIKTYISKYSYDLYENRVILGFLKNVIDYLENQIIGFAKEIIEVENIPDSIVLQLPNTHGLTGKCIYVYYKGVVDKFSEKKDILEEIYYRYEKNLKCIPEDIYGLPKLTNTFKQIYHYRICYECMVKWFETGDYTFDHLNYLFKLKTLSRIFEYYCLIKIQNAISLCGFILRESDRIIYDVEDDSENINNRYIFEGNGYEITLLYEPSIWIDRNNGCTNLYSTGYNFIKSRWNDRWRPDFVLKISGNYKDYYYILDAKYSNFYNVKRRHIPALVLKYGTQIASKDKFFSDVIGIGAIYPSKEDKIYYFKKNVIDSQKNSLPQYFSLTIVDGNLGTQNLKKQMEKLFKVADKIEEDCENIGSSKKEMSLNNLEIEHEKIEDETKIFAEKNGSSNINVSGKNCFYYAKNICLCQKKTCTIINAPCECYIPKKSRELLKEDRCRNLIQYVKRNKTNGRVECSISGLPGCIGTEQCKFYLKKNVHK